MNNRELATVIWLAVALAWCLRQQPVRAGLREVVRNLLHPKVIGPIAALAAWTVGLVLAARVIGWWDADLRNDTVVWFLTVGVVFLFSLRRVTEDRFLRRTARRAVGWTVFVEGFANLAVMPLAAELVLLPVATFVVLLATVAEAKDEHAALRRPLNGVLTLIGLGLLVYVALSLIRDFDAAGTVEALALPVWLTFGTLPFVYGVGLVAAYESAFVRIDCRTDDPVRRRRAKLALLRAANVRASELGGFALHWIGDLVSNDTDAEARALMQRWRASWRTEARDSRMENARDCMQHWLEQTDPALAEVVADLFRDMWKRLDTEQRAALRAEGLAAADASQAESLRELPA